MSEVDHYRTLGLRRFAPPDSVRHAFVTLIKQHHPDSGGAAVPAESATRIASAYWELRHPERRARYDDRLRADLRRRARRRALANRFDLVAPAGPGRGARMASALCLLAVVPLIAWSIHHRPQPRVAERPASAGGESMRAVTLVKAD